MTIRIPYAQKMQAVNATVQGATKTEIATILGTDRRTAGRVMSRPDVKAKIEYMQRELVERGFDVAVKNIVDSVNAVRGVDPTSENKGDLLTRQQGMENSRKIVESVGLLPSHSQATYIQAQINVQNNTYTSPVVDAALANIIDSGDKGLN